MIPKEIHEQLEAQWQGRKYATRKRLKKRQQHLEPLLRLFTEKDVLELGSNAGILAYEITKWSKSYLGIEPDKVYYEQALLTSQHLNQPFKFINNTLALSVKEIGNINAFIMCVALYLLNKEELNLLKNIVFPKCDVVIIQERKAKRPSREDYNPYGLHEPKKIRDFLRDCGFNTEVYFSFNEKYFEVLGVRN